MEIKLVSLLQTPLDCQVMNVANTEKYPDLPCYYDYKNSLDLGMH